jgi:hypothetical protein
VVAEAVVARGGLAAGGLTLSQKFVDFKSNDF